MANEDGSFTIHFGPEEPAEPANWVRTDPERGWLAMARFYGPKRSYIAKSWVLDDIVEA